VAQRYKNRRNKTFDIDAAKKLVQTALIEDPGPSFFEIARRLDHKRDFVRLKLPELSKAITTRYLQYRTVLRREKSQKLRQAIREAISHFTALNLYVSEARVTAYIKPRVTTLGRYSLFKQVLREVKAEMRISK
jgi:hypothetical protein